MSFLQMKGRKYLVFGVFNKKSIAYHTAKVVKEEGGEIILAVKDETIKEKVKDFFPGSDVFVCDVEKQDEIEKLADDISNKHGQINGMLHAIAFADFSEGFKPFYETKRNHFLQAMDISCYSLINISNALKGVFDKQASIVTLSVPFTKTVVEIYSFMAPVKAALESSIAYLAKSFSSFSQIRFNTVCTSFIKTSAAAGIPKFLDAYMFAEKTSLRKKGIKTNEVADVIAFMLSNRSCLINAQSVIADDGMSVNIFDDEVVEAVNKAVFGK